MNHHFRSQSEMTGLLQAGQPIVNSQNLTVPDGSSNGFIRIHSDTQGSLDELFNFNPPTTKPPLPLRLRKLPSSFFDPSTAQTANVNHQPSFHARSTSFDHGPKPSTVHMRTQSVLAPMTNLAISDNSLCQINGSNTNSNSSLNAVQQPMQQPQPQQRQQQLSVQPQSISIPAQQQQPVQTLPVQPMLPQQQPSMHQMNQERPNNNHHYRNYSSPAFMPTNEVGRIHHHQVQATVCHSRPVVQHQQQQQQQLQQFQQQHPSQQQHQIPHQQNQHQPIQQQTQIQHHDHNQTQLHGHNGVQHQHQTHGHLHHNHNHNHNHNHSHTQQPVSTQHTIHNHHHNQAQYQDTHFHTNHAQHVNQHQHPHSHQFQHNQYQLNHNQYQPQYQEAHCQQVGTWLT